MLCPRFLRVRPALLAVMLTFLITTALGAAEPHPSLPPPVVPDCLGVNIHFTDPKPGELEMLAAAGFKWVRMDLTWAGTERKKGEYDFSAFDRLVAKLDAFQLRAVFILDYGNPLYADAGEQQPFTSRAGTPEFREAFARWAVAAVSHFQGRGYLWEMWNEPNGGFWKPKADVQQYIALTRTTGEALRAAHLLGPKDEAFIGPATSTIDLPFLEACFQGGLLEFWDGVSVHPYRQNAPETSVEEYRQLRLLIGRYAPPEKTIPVISGEWGYSSAWTTQGKDEAARKEQQGKYLPRQFLTNIANDVALSIWYDWHDDGPDPKEAEHRFGIVENQYHAGRDPVYDPKPAYTAMKTLTEQLGGFRFNKELSLDQPEHHALLFSKDAEVRTVEWGTSHDAPAYGQTGQPNDLWQLAAAWQRLPLEILVTPDRSPNVRLFIHNPLGREIFLEGPQKSLGPNESYTYDVPFAPSRRDAVTVRQTLAVRGLGRLQQSTVVRSTAPLIVTVLPPGAKTAWVQIQNPTGETFQGRLRLSPVSQSVEVSLAKGEKEKIVTIALDRPLPPGEPLSAALDEGDRRDVAGAEARYHRLFFDTGDSAHPIDYSMTAEGDAKVAGSATVEAGSTENVPAYIEDTVFTIHYTFGAGWKYLTLGRSEIPWPTIQGQPARFGLWIKGDGRKSVARLRFKDTTGQVFQSDAGEINWQGWRFVTFPLRGTGEKTLAHWGGANDGVIHYPIRWETPLLLDNVSRQPLDGEIAISMPTLID